MLYPCTTPKAYYWVILKICGSLRKLVCKLPDGYTSALYCLNRDIRASYRLDPVGLLKKALEGSRCGTLHRTYHRAGSFSCPHPSNTRSNPRQSPEDYRNQQVYVSKQNVKEEVCLCRLHQKLDGSVVRSFHSYKACSSIRLSTSANSYEQSFLLGASMQCLTSNFVSLRCSNVYWMANLADTNRYNIAIT